MHFAYVRLMHDIETHRNMSHINVTASKQVQSMCVHTWHFCHLAHHLTGSHIYQAWQVRH